MREASFISEIRAALRRRGVWGARGERLIRDWTDHVHDDAAQRVEEGAEAKAAEESAWKALGGPEDLAASAARELARGSWLGRHPWLGGMVLPGLGWIGFVLAVVLIPGWILFGGGDLTDSMKLVPALRCWALAVNWLPWLLSMAWLGWMAARMPGGWKLYWITVVALGVCGPAAKMAVYPPLHGPHSGAIYVYVSGALSSILQYVIRHLPVIGPHFRDLLDDFLASRPLGPRLPQRDAWIQTAILLFGAAAFYLQAIGSRKSKVETLAG